METGLDYTTERRPDVDFVTTVFERTYREMFEPGRIRAMVADHCYPFKRVVVLVNNVDDRASVEVLLRQLKADGEITDFHFVADHLDDAFQRTGLTRGEVAKTVYYTNHSLVAVCLPGSPCLLFCDADVRLREPADWVSPGLALMARDSRIAVVNPDWDDSSLRDEAREYTEEFGIGYGFSDQLYLIQRAEFAGPIYRHWTPVSMRYPLAHLAPIFEQRVDAYMRSKRRLRATYTRAVYLHLAEEGASHPRGSRSEQLKRRLTKLMVRVCGLLPVSDPRVHS